MNKIKFIDRQHETFYKEKLDLLKQFKKDNPYYKSLIYTLGICNETRRNFKKIFNIETSDWHIDSLKSAWQTTTSKKVTRLAFNLFSDTGYESEKDLEDDKNSSNYNISEIFSCSYAPYFYEAVKIRYPEYTSEQQMKNDISVGTYARVGNIGQLDYYVKEKIENNVESIVGLYMRSGQKDEDEVNKDIYSQQEKLEKFCEENNIHNRKLYIDVRKSGMSIDRKALKQMSDDIDKGIIKKVIVTSPSKLYRDIIKLYDFIGFANYKNVEVNSLDSGLMNTNIYSLLVQNHLKNELQEEKQELEEHEENMEF